MSFLIKLKYNNIDILNLYEEQLIYSVANMNRIYIDHHELPSLCLGCLRIRYKDYESETEYLEIEHISQMLKQGYGKCDSIVAWYIMIFQMNNIEAAPYIIPTNKGGFHVQMKYREGNSWKIIDPSINLKNMVYENCNECRVKINNGTFNKGR